MKILCKLFKPKTIIGLPICIFTIILLIYVFSYNLEDNIISYIAYLLSTYSLIIFIIWFIKTCKFSFQEIKKTNIYHWYCVNKDIITKYKVLIISIGNFFFGLFELISGLYFKSWWFITLAIYYLILCLMRFSFLQSINQDNKYQKLRATGLVLLFLNLILIGMIILIIKQDRTFIYANYLIYAVALYDFSLIINSIIHVFKAKNNKNPLIIAHKFLNLTVAMISILSLEVAMIYQFGNNDSHFKLLMTSYTGFVIAIINTWMSIILIKKANCVLKKK